MQKIKSILGEQLDCCVLLSPANRFYFTQIDTSFGCVVLTREKKYFLTDFRYQFAAEEALGGKGWEIRIIGYSALFEQIKDIVQQNSSYRIGLEMDHLTIATFRRLEEALAGFELLPCDTALLTARAIKSEDEIALIQKSQQINEIALQKTLSQASPRMTERELCAEYSYQLLKAGADGYSFDPIVAGGVYTAQPHHKVSDYCIEKNEPILFDVGGKYKGYCSDMTRTVCLGDPSKEMTELYKLVLDAQLYTLSKLRAGMTCHEADSLAREYFAANGKDQYFGHSLGHGVGIDIHEHPGVAKKNDVVLQENMVVTVEPGLYIDGVGGVRIEDMVVITSDGIRNLTSFHKKFEI